MPRADLREITAVVQAADPHPIMSIHRVTESHPTPGSRPVTQFLLGPDGRVSKMAITLYERADQVIVNVETEFDKSTGGSYVVAKRGSEWKIIRKSFWIK
jgi:hypothetical protein